MKKIIAGALCTMFLLSNSIIAFAGQWEQDSHGWKYKTSDDWYVSNQFFSPNSGGHYHFGNDEYMTVGWVQDRGKWYYLDPNDGGNMATNKSLVLNGVNYTFNQKGEWFDDNNPLSTYGLLGDCILQVKSYTNIGNGQYKIKGILCDSKCYKDATEVHVSPTLEGSMSAFNSIDVLGQYGAEITTLHAWYNDEGLYAWGDGYVTLSKKGNGYVPWFHNPEGGEGPVYSVFNSDVTLYIDTNTKFIPYGHNVPPKNIKEFLKLSKEPGYKAKVKVTGTHIDILEDVFDNHAG